MGTPTRERVRAYRARLREQGGCRLSITLDSEARAALDALRAQHPDQSIDRIISNLLAGNNPLPCNNSPTPSPLPGNDPDPLPCNGFSLPGNSPLDRRDLAVIGHQWRQEGATLEEIAERFNANGWTPAVIPKRKGVAPRVDSSRKWTDKAISQLLSRDYPHKD